MPLTDQQATWLETAQAKSADFAKFGATMDLKNKELEKMSADIERIQDELRKANAEMKISVDDKKKFWTSAKTEMDWMSGDRDEEVDTKHDLKGDFDVDPAQAKKLQKLHMELVAIQTRMENTKAPDSVDKDGKTVEGGPLFGRKDIERELWSPLVSADILPSNAVSDKYSQEAQIWNGACEIYKDKLEDYSATASKYENAKRGLKITTDVVSFCGSIAGESIKAANFDGLTISAADKKMAAEFKAIPEGKRTPEQAQYLTTFANREMQATTAARDLQALQVTTTVLNGALSVADSSLEKRDSKTGWKIAEAAFDAISNAAVASLGAVSKSVAVSNPALAGDANFSTSMASATSLVQYGFKAAKVVFRVNDICSATDEAGRIAGAQGLVKAIAGAVGDAFAAFDIQSGTGSDGTEVKGDTKWSKIGALAATGIIASANVGFIAKHIKSSIDAGGLKSPTALIGAMGLTIIGPILLGVFDQMRKGSDEELDGDGVVEVNDQLEQSMDLLKDSAQNEDNAKQLAEGMDAKKMEEQILAALKKLPPMDPKDLPKGVNAEDAQREIAKSLAKKEAEDKEKQIGDFQKSLKDPETKEKFFRAIKDASDEEIGKLKELIGDSQIDPEDLQQDEARAKKAMAAMDKLIAEAQALNTRWQMVEMMTSGGAAILVAALPVAGLAVAIQKLAMDVAILVRKSIELNKWIKNQALTVGNNSSYGSAISGQLSRISVQVSQQSVRVIFDAIGVAAESAKLADCMGVATGLSIGNSMARALTEFGYKMHKEAEIDRGWKLYKQARESPGDRKKARKAMKWNSTLSKCVLAYGIVKDGDPIAKEVGRSCGLTPEILADTKDVCGKVVTYFETLYSDDPVVMKRIPLTKDWHPGSPKLSIDSWLRFKAAAVSRAKPGLSDASARTPDIDRQLTLLLAHIGQDANFEAKRDAVFPAADPSKPDSEDKRVTTAYKSWLEGGLKELNGVVGAMRAWKPLTGPCPDGTEKPWAEGMVHTGMDDVRQGLIAQAQILVGEVIFEIDVADQAIKNAEALKKIQDEGVKALLDEEPPKTQDSEDGTEKEDEKKKKKKTKEKEKEKQDV